MTATADWTYQVRPEAWSREHVANLFSLFVLSMIMNDGRDEAGILHLALTSVAPLGPCRSEAGYLPSGDRLVRTPAQGAPDTSGLEDRLRHLRGSEGQVPVPGREWGWAFPLNSGDGVGYLVVGAASQPARDEHFLVQALAQQTSVALANAVARRRARKNAGELRRLNEDRKAVNGRLATSVAELEHQRSVHEVLSEVAASDSGVPGIARAVRGLTGCSVAVEDQFGNLIAWTGPGRPDPYPKPDAARHEELLQDVARRLLPLRVGDRLVALAQHRGEVLGSMALVVGDGHTAEEEKFVLDHACNALALELAHLRNLAEVELRLRRELVDDLISGTDDESAYARAAAVGHDLHGPHWMAVVEWEGRTDDIFVQAVGRAAAGLRIRSLFARRSGTAVLVLEGQPRSEALHLAVARELGPGIGSIGIGGRCDAPAKIPRSYREALRALEVRRLSREPHGVTSYEDLGLFRMLGSGGDYQQVETFVREWLGPLMAYDAAHHSELVQTLFQYFECGGNYDGTAAELAIHRSTLRYRLQRIREISGSDLKDVDSRLNLHVATRAWKILGGSPR
ncbi:helix-turn-helix domain-containing protein [Streptomyces sp. NPDC051098]|uniref:PucR family transcriptional regulator n=1 Tax=Streptomyces sp. NPDC051098 TaxID=3155411 RepID=UPI003449FAF7